MSQMPEVRINAKGVTTMSYEVFRELDHGAICQALGLPYDRAVKTRRPKRSKR